MFTRSRSAYICSKYTMLPEDVKFMVEMSLLKYIHAFKTQKIFRDD